MIAEVTWLDAAFYDVDWTHKKARNKGGLVRCSTVGHLVDETDEYLAISQTKSKNSFGEIIYIPWGMIVEWTTYE